MHVSWAEELDKAAHCLHCCLIYVQQLIEEALENTEDGVKVNGLLVMTRRLCQVVMLGSKG